MTETKPTITTYEPRLVMSADGTRIYADAVGNQSPYTPVIVLVHGFSVISRAFDPMFEDSEWTSKAFLVRYDLRGHGKSDKPMDPMRWMSHCFSQDFEAVCKEFNVRKVFFFGWSLGVVQFIDIFNYNTTIIIEGLINVAGPPYCDPSHMVRLGVPETIPIIAGLVQPQSVEKYHEAAQIFVRKCSYKLPPKLFRILYDELLKQPGATVKLILSRIQDPSRMMQAARDGRVNSLLIIGMRDKLLNPQGLLTVMEELGFKNQTTKCLQQADHMPWVSTPDIFRDVILEWIAGLKRN